MDSRLIKLMTALTVAIVCSVMVLRGFSVDSIMFQTLRTVSTVYFAIDYVYAKEFEFQLHHMAICTINVSSLFMNYDKSVGQYMAERLLYMELSTVPLTIGHIMTHLRLNYGFTGHMMRTLRPMMDYVFLVSFLVFRIGMSVQALLSPTFQNMAVDKYYVLITSSAIVLTLLNFYWLTIIIRKYIMKR
jgi:hypothetical protein